MTLDILMLWLKERRTACYEYLENCDDTALDAEYRGRIAELDSLLDSCKKQKANR